MCSMTKMTTTNAARFYSVGGARVFKSISTVNLSITEEGWLGEDADWIARAPH